MHWILFVSFLTLEIFSFTFHFLLWRLFSVHSRCKTSDSRGIYTVFKKGESSTNSIISSLRLNSHCTSFSGKTTLCVFWWRKDWWSKSATCSDLIRRRLVLLALSFPLSSSQPWVVVSLWYTWRHWWEVERVWPDTAQKHIILYFCHVCPSSPFVFFGQDESSVVAFDEEHQLITLCCKFFCPHGG